MAEALKINTTLTSIDVSCAPRRLWCKYGLPFRTAFASRSFVVVIVCVCVVVRSVLRVCSGRWRRRSTLAFAPSEWCFVFCICRVFVVRRGVSCFCVVSFVVYLVSWVRFLVVCRVYHVCVCVFVSVLCFRIEVCCVVCVLRSLLRRALVRLCLLMGAAHRARS